MEMVWRREVNRVATSRPARTKFIHQNFHNLADLTGAFRVARGPWVCLGLPKC